MYSGNKLPKVGEFLEKRKKLKLWHRLLLLAGSIVVFITTYMLILPAITAEIGTLDAYMSEDSVSSGSAVVDGATSGNYDEEDLTEGTTEATTEEEKDSDSSSGSGSTVLADGTIINITLEDVKAEEEETESLFSNLIALAADGESSVSLKYYGDGNDDSFVAKYDPETGDFDVNLNIDFVLPQDALLQYKDSVVDIDNFDTYYTIKLPTGVILPDDLVYEDDGSPRVYYGYKTGTTYVIFHYYFVPYYNADGSIATDEYGHIVYTSVMVFDQEYLDSLSGGDIEGTMNIKAYLGSEYYNKDGEIIIEDDSYSEPIKIEVAEIEFPENSTVNYDITVQKKGNYNASDNTITYTVMVITQKGTGDTVVVYDSFSNSDFLTKLNAELLSVEYKQGIIGIDSNEWGTNIADWYTEFTETETILDGEGTTTYTYDGNGNLVITLPGLEAAEEGPYSEYEWAKAYEKANAYYITYKYSINPEADTTYTGENTARVDIYDTTADVTIYDESTAKVMVDGKKTITKTGAYNSSEEIITWMIIVGDGENSVNGYILYDDMFADLESVDDLVITDKDANTISSEYYEILYGDDGKISGIKFISGEDEVIQYVITYETSEVQEWVGKTIKNEAELETPDGSIGDDASVYVGGLSDCFNKSLDQVKKQDDGTYFLSWDISFTVPKSGIPEGVTFTDYLEGDGHYLTAAQAIAVRDALINAWGEDAVTNIQFYTGSNRYNMDESLWVDAGSINADDTETKYYQFRYTIAKDIEYSEDEVIKIEYSYETTADVVSASQGKKIDTITYYNTIYDSETGKSHSASWSYYKEVVKYGTTSNGSMSSLGDTEITVTDGQVSWIVRVVLTPENKYTIVDTLPEGVTLSGIFVATNNTNCDMQLGTEEVVELTNGVSGTVNVKYVSYSEEDNKITIKAENVATNRNMLFIKYVCTIDKTEDSSSDDSTSAGSLTKTYEFKNSVVAYEEGNDDEEYGSDDQTTKVTWSDEEEIKRVLTKNDQFDKNNNVVKYTLNVNSMGTTYSTASGEVYSDLVLEDVLEYKSYPSSGLARDASLVLSSLKLYYAKTDDNGNILYDRDGNLQKGTQLSPDEYTWTYDVDLKEYSWETDAKKIITLTVPNGKALVLEYEFLVTIIVDDNASWADMGANVTNSATLSVGGEKISGTTGVETKDKVNESGTSASAHGAAGFTIYKVDANNFSLPLAEAEFDLYVWQKGSVDEDGNVIEAGFKNLSTFTTNSAGYTGITGTLKTDPDTEEKYYEIILSDGSTYNLPTDTICYFVESSAPDGYKTDKEKRYYFYYGSNVATTLSSVLNNCDYSGDDEISSATNLIISHTQYVTNTHSWDYYAAKTSLSVIKRWVDSTGNEITKTDGGVKFKLYRVFTDMKGNQTTDPYSDEGIADDGNNEDSGNIPKLTWTVYDKNKNVNTDYSGSVTCEKDSTVTLNLSYGGWQPYVLVMDTSGNILSYVPGQYDNYSGMTNADGTNKWEYNSATGKYVFGIPIDIGTDKNNILIYIGASDSEITDSAKVWVTGGVEVTTTEPTTEVTTQARETTESTTTAYYYHIFDRDELDISTGTEISNIKGDYLIYKGTSDSSEQSANYFTISGSLTQSHGTTYWDVNGDGSVTSDELLSTALKMETDYDKSTEGSQPTNISFTANESGKLTLVFNAAGNGSETSTITNSVYIDGVLYAATNNVIEAYLDAGEHTISRASYCFLFYMAFEEGATSGSSTTSAYIHNFDSGTISTFYEIKGSTTSYKGTVVYEDLNIATCLKMNSNASISFDAPEDGTLYLVLTNPNGAKTQGVMIDGVAYYAVSTGEYDSNGNLIYELTTRVSAGEHTITRINSTELMLYHIEYIPDDFGSGEPVYTTPNNEYGVYVGEYDITASNDWSWSSTNLKWQVIDDDGNLLGYYSYYVVEEDEEGSYITYYINNSSDGIQSGSIAIYNQDKSDSSTAISVIKKWLDLDGNTLSDDEAKDKESITFDLMARVHIYDEYSDSYTGGTDYSRYFTQKATLENDSDGFFTVSKTVQSSNLAGEVTFKPATAENSITSRYYLKFDSSGKVSFTSPATSGILTLITYNWTGSSLSKGLGFKLTSPSGKVYSFLYSADSDNGLSGTYPGTLSNAAETLAGDDTGVEITAISTSQDPSTTGILTFTIFTDEAGEWTITQNGGQEYLLYMDYSYQYQYLAEGEGVYINSYTISADEDWTKTISGLPYLIFDDDGKTEIGYYSYYVVETSPSDGYVTTIDYYTKDKDGNLILTSDKTITNGEAVITNQEKVVGVTLPETGGVGTKVYTIGGALLLCCALYLLYIRKINKGEINFK